jgi:endonuclease/exonuclease/phosphatase family metal-dependent hydrolase
MRVSTKVYIAAVLAIGLMTCPLSALGIVASDDDKLLEIGSTSRNNLPAKPPAKIKVVSFNIRYRSGSDLEELIRLFREDPEIGGASILGLQEVDRNKKRSGFTNTAKLIAESIGMNYAWAAPPPAKSDNKDTEREEETGVAILSQFALSDVERIVLPNEGPGGRRRVALGATVLMGNDKIRIYSVHAETRISSKEKLAQLETVLDDLAEYPDVQRAVVMGDFNTLQGDAVSGTSRLFIGRQFNTPFENDDATWRTFILKLKLDWMWHRGFCVDAYGIDKKVGLSDHWPLWMDLGTDNCTNKTVSGPRAERPVSRGRGSLLNKLLVFP